MKAKLEVADVFRRYWKQYKSSHPITKNQRKVMAAITSCRTSQPGGHSEVCDNCASMRNSYNSCIIDIVRNAKP